MCRLSGRHSDIFYCWANCCQHESRPLPVSMSSPTTVAPHAVRNLKSKSGTGVLQLGVLELGVLELRVIGVGRSCKFPLASKGRVRGAIRARASRARRSNLGAVWRLRHADTVADDVSNARPGERCGRQAPRGWKVWTQESATLAPDSRRIVAFVSLRHDISCDGSVSRVPRVNRQCGVGVG